MLMYGAFIKFNLSKSSKLDWTVLNLIHYNKQAYKPGSVVDSHLSWHGVTGHALATYLKRDGQPQAFCLVLLPAGFTEPSGSPRKR